MTDVFEKNQFLYYDGSPLKHILSMGVQQSVNATKWIALKDVNVTIFPNIPTQLTFTRLKLTTETLEKGVKYVQS